MTYHLFSKKWHGARKPHTCVWCYGRIVKTEVYLREKSIFEGHHQNHAWHWDCWFDAQENYFKHGESEFTSGMDRPLMLPFRSMEAT